MSQRLRVGHVKLQRRILDSDIFQEAKPEFLKVFLYLMLAAQYKDGEFFYAKAGITIPVKTGQVLRSIETISLDCGVSFRAVQSALSFMEKRGMISRKAVGPVNRSITCITLENYGKHQEKPLTGTVTGTHTGTMRIIETNQNVPLTGTVTGPATCKEVQEVKENVNRVCPEPSSEPVQNDQLRKDREAVRQWLKDCPNWIDTPEFYAVNKATGRIRFIESLAAWRISCPNVSRPKLLVALHSWETDNPQRFKKNKIRFIGACMRSENKKGPGRTDENQKNYTPIPRGTMSTAGFGTPGNILGILPRLQEPPASEPPAPEKPRFNVVRATPLPKPKTDWVELSETELLKVHYDKVMDIGCRTTDCAMCKKLEEGGVPATALETALQA